MQTEHHLDRMSLEETLFNHDTTTTLALFRRLKDEHHGAIKTAQRGKRLNGTEQHRGMTIMAAGMHPPGMTRMVGEGIQFG